MKTVWLDAGHGGIDTGAVNHNLHIYEKDVALMLVLEIEKQLNQQGINVIMTRRKDKTLNYIPRYKLENNNPCNLAISIHLNSCAKPNTARGCEIWIHSKSSKILQNWANNTLNEILKVSGTVNRGVKKGYPSLPNCDFWCNRLTRCMSMLIEIGFVNNDDDTRLVMSHITDYAKAGTKSVCKQLSVTYNDKTVKNTSKNVYDFEIMNLNDNNLGFLLDAEMKTGERFEDWLIRQGYRVRVRKR